MGTPKRVSLMLGSPNARSRKHLDLKIIPTSDVPAVFPCELLSKVLQGGEIVDDMGEYYRGY